MTEEQINQRIAEACGWTSVKEDFECVLGRPPNTSDLYCRVPNYAGCLNAMYEAEKVLTGYQQTVTYSDNLIKIVGYGTFDSAHATAAQRAEAFLKTLNIWKS